MIGLFQPSLRLWIILCLFILQPIKSTNHTVNINNTWAFAFATIPPRFNRCSETIQSLLRQTIKPKHVIIYVTQFWDPNRKIRDPSAQKTLEFSNYDNANKLRKKIYEEFPEEWKNGVISVVEMPKDFGPATKLVGVLMTFSLYHVDYWIINDDDLIYDENVIRRYFTEFQKNTMNRDIGPVFTLFNSLFNSFNVNIYGKKLFIPQVQGADTYVIPSLTLLRQSLSGGPLSYAKFPLFLEYIYQICPESYYNDDFLISFSLRLAKLHVESLWNKRIPYVVNDENHNSELHLDPLDRNKKDKTISCLHDEANTISKIWGLKRTTKKDH
eukprot:gene5339-10681_t